MTAQTTRWGGRPGIHSHVSDGGEIRAVGDAMSGSRRAPTPFLQLRALPPQVAAQPRDHPLQKANNTLAEDGSLSEAALVRRAESPPGERAPAPLEHPAAGPRRLPVAGPSRASGLGVGEGSLEPGPKSAGWTCHTSARCLLG